MMNLRVLRRALLGLLCIAALAAPLHYATLPGSGSEPIFLAQASDRGSIRSYGRGGAMILHSTYLVYVEQFVNPVQR